MATVERAVWFQDSRTQLDAVLMELCKEVQLSPARYQLAVQRYGSAADTPMFGAIGDSAPDRWGRALMRRMERRRAEREGTAPRTLQEIDFLLLVDDEARQATKSATGTASTKNQNKHTKANPI